MKGYETLLTPLAHPLKAPTAALTQAIETEWEQDSSPHYQNKLFTSLAATAIDRVGKAREAYVKGITQAVGTDVLLFWASLPGPLVKLQQEKWGPLLEAVNAGLGLSLRPTMTLEISPLSLEEEENIQRFLRSFTDFQLTGFFHLSTLLTSFCLPYLIQERKLSPENAWDLAHLHEHEQSRIWGEQEERMTQEQQQRQEVLQTVEFLKLVE